MMNRYGYCSFFKRRNKCTFSLLIVVVAIAAQGVLGEQVSEEVTHAAGVSMAATLLGSISFIMCLYYFTNWPDPDIKKYSWEIISSTISIFCAVLLFSSFNDLVEAYFIDYYGFGPVGTFLSDMFHMLFWFTFLQILLCLFSGAITVDYDAIKDDSKAMEEELESRELNMKCFATLLAHLTGFASINAWGSLQQTMASNPVFAMMAVVIAFCGMYSLQRLTAKIRETVNMGDDGEQDPFETMWDTETEEAENDVMSLTLSFMTVNAWRFAIIGCMPNQEGQEEYPACPSDNLFHHSFIDKVLLWGSAFVFTSGVFLMHYNMPEDLDAIKFPISTEAAKRVCQDIMATVSMCFSWSTFYGVQMVLAGLPIFEGQEELLSVVLALVCSLGVFALMLPLDWLADQDWTDDRCDAGIRATMDAFAILVGFAWEQSFDTSVDALATSTSNPHRSKFVLSMFCAGLLVPAWKWYMLPFIIKQGWRFGYVTGPHDVQGIFSKMLEEDDHYQAERHEESKTLQIIQQLHQDHDLQRKLPSFKGYIAPTLPATVPEESEGSEDISTAPLSGEEAFALRQRVVDLTAALAKTERERDNAQNMVAYQMEAMLENMKKLNLTVTRIP